MKKKIMKRDNTEKIDRPNEKDRSVLVFLIVWVTILCGSGSFLTFYYYPARMEERKRISALPVMNAKQLTELNVGGEAIITGNLAENAIVDEKRQYVAFHTYIWDVEVENNGSTEGEWIEEDDYWPSLTVAVKGGKIRVSGKISPKTVPWRRGYRHKAIVEKNSDKVASYELRKLGNGSLMIRGAKNLDPVSIVARKISSGEFQAKYLYFGSRRQMLDSAIISAFGFKIFGIILIVAGIASGLIVVFRSKF